MACSMRALVLAVLLLGACTPKVEKGETKSDPVADVLGPTERYGLSNADIAAMDPAALVEKALEKSDLDTLEAAASEDGLSLSLLCLARYHGVKGARDLAAAATDCRRAHEKGLPLGTYTLAQMTRAGEGGIAADAAAANALLREAANKGDARAQADLALAERARAPASARSAAEGCAAQGSAACKFLLAQMQAAGEGGPKDLAAAKAGYEALALSYYAPAIRELGKFWRDGIGVAAPDAEEAVVHFKRAAVLGDGEASFLLGKMADAEKGGVTKAEAAGFYEEARAAGYPPADAAPAKAKK
jgi:TPR repeat protein